MIKFLSYVSQQRYSLTDKALEKLLIDARISNEANEVTGFLILHQGLFIQYIEGPDENIEKLFSKIKKDPRHKKVTGLDTGSISQRQFENWSMAFERLTPEKAKKLSGYKEFVKEEVFLTGKTKENPALLLLNSFVKNL